MNLPTIAQFLRDAAFPDVATGAAYVRWSETTGRPEAVPEGVNGLLALARLGVRTDPTSSSWLQHDYNLHVWLVPREGDPVEFVGDSLGDIVRRVINATVRARVDRDEPLIRKMQSVEEKLFDIYRQPTESERYTGLRYAVFPLCAAVISEVS